MKKLLLSSFLLAASLTNLKAQVCMVLRDSVTSGSDATAHSVYYYDAQNRISKMEYYPAGQSNIGQLDSLFYNVNGENIQIKKYGNNGSNYYVYQTIDKTFTSGKITRIFTSGNNGSPWTSAHDLTYNGNGTLASAILDPTSVTGNADGFMGSFINIAYTAGNVSFVKLIIGQDTIELNATADTKNCLRKMLPIEEPGDVLESLGLNNILLVTLANNETSPFNAPAGTIAVEQNYTYNTMNNVATMTVVPSLFESQGKTIQYTYNACNTNTGISNNETSDLNLYPNPAQNQITIALKSSAAEFKLMDLNGRVIMTSNIKSNKESIDISNLSSGIYFIEVISAEGTERSKLVKN